jgi:hypothetical protein
MTTAIYAVDSKIQRLTNLTQYCGRRISPLGKGRIISLFIDRVILLY